MLRQEARMKKIIGALFHSWFVSRVMQEESWVQWIPNNKHCSFPCPDKSEDRILIKQFQSIWFYDITSTGDDVAGLYILLFIFILEVLLPFEHSCPSVGWSVGLSKFIGKLNEIILLAISNQPSLCLNHQTVASSIYEVWTGSNFNWPKIIKFFLLSFLTFIFSVMNKEKLIIYAFTLSIELYLWNQMEHVTKTSVLFQSQILTQVTKIKC